MLRTTCIGNYPKLPSEKGQVNIRKTLHRFDKKEITRAELDEAFDSVTARVILEQIEAGVDLPTDGQIRWDDIVTPLAKHLAGFEIGGLLRWFDNNVYYRKPKVSGAVQWRDPITVNQFRFASKKAGKAVKAILPAPYSFALLSDNSHYGNQKLLVEALSDALRSEAEALISAGATHIQFDDPCLPYSPEDADLAFLALNNVTNGLKAEFWTCYYFSNISNLMPKIGQLKIDVIAADCVSHPANVDSLISLGGKFKCCFGIVDARNIKMEEPAQLQKTLKRIAAQNPDAYISPSCGLEFLPHREALAKIRLMTKAVAETNGGSKNA